MYPQYPKRWDSDEVHDAVSNNLLSAGNNTLDPDNAIADIISIPPGTTVDVDLFNSLIASVNTRIEALNNEDTLNRKKLGLIWRLHGLSSKVVSTKLAFGLLHQPKWIPLRYCPLVLELELVNNFTDVCVTPYDSGDANIASRFPANLTSAQWSIEQVEVKCDLCTLDNALENSYEEHLLDAGSLPINYNTYINQTQNISGQTDVAINVSRAISRLKSIFINFSKKTSSDRNSGTRADVAGTWDNGILASFGDINKPFNGFYNPMSGQQPRQEIHDPDLELECQIQIGSKQFPEYPIKSGSESFAQLRKTMGILGSTLGSLDIEGQMYNKLHHIIALDTEKTLQAGYTGLDMKRGQLMTVKIKASNPTALPAARMPDNMNVV